eukprot:gene24766-32252_t
MSEELSVKDKIALFSKKNSTPPLTPDLHSRRAGSVTKKNSTTSDAIKQSYFGSTIVKGDIDILKQLVEPISKTDSEMETLKVMGMQAAEIVQLKAEISKYKIFVEGQTCIICMTRLRNVLFLPCSHCCVCKECNEKSKFSLYECPICKSTVQSRLKVLYP